jgi:outer membrane protein, heavy metal efflux system
MASSRRPGIPSQALIAASLVFLAAVSPAVAQEDPDLRQVRASSESADPFAGVEQLDRATLVAAVLKRNPDLEAARAAWEAAVQRVPQARSLMDPELSYGIAPLSVFSDDAPFGNVVEARQMLPYPGTLRLRGEAAEARAAAERQRIEQVRLELARMAADLLYDLYLVERSLAINAEHVRLLEELKESATTRYASGLVPQQVPLQAEVELTHLVHRDVTLGTARSLVTARLNALLHRPPASPLPPPAPGAAGWPAAPAEAPHAHAAAGDPARHHALVERALAARPELAAAAAEVEARRLERELAGLEGKPDFGVMGTYSSMWRETEHRWMVGVSVRLPVWRERIAAVEAEAEAELAAAAARQAALADRVAAEVAQAADLYAEMSHVVELYESRLMPVAYDQLRAARSGFESGQVDFIAVVEAEKNLRTVELGFEEARTDRHRRLAALERALGAEPGALLAPPPDPARAEGSAAAPEAEPAAPPAAEAQSDTAASPSTEEPDAAPESPKSSNGPAADAAGGVR